MNLPVQVTFRHVPVSDAIEAECWWEAEKLERYFDRIIACRVVIDEPHRRHRQGNLHQVRIDLTLPGAELVVTREPPAHHECETFEVAIREAFDSMRRRLEDHVRIQRGDTKKHDEAPIGHVTHLDANDRYGFIRTDNGREVYFHAHSLPRGGFDDLEIGDEVRFVEVPGVKGPQASTVVLHADSLPSVAERLVGK